MSKEQLKAAEASKPEAAKPDDKAQAFVRPPAQGGKKEYTLPSGTKVQHN